MRGRDGEGRDGEGDEAEGMGRGMRRKGWGGDGKREVRRRG